MSESQWCVVNPQSILKCKHGLLRVGEDGAARMESPGVHNRRVPILSLGKCPFFVSLVFHTIAAFRSYQLGGNSIAVCLSVLSTTTTSGLSRDSRLR